MAGEINGTNIVIQNGTGEIVGQMETTLTMAGTLIDISNKSNGDFITNMAGALAGKQLNFSGTLVYNSTQSLIQATEILQTRALRVYLHLTL